MKTYQAVERSWGQTFVLRISSQGNSGDATHDPSLPVPARQTGRSSLR